MDTDVGVFWHFLEQQTEPPLDTITQYYTTELIDIRFVAGIKVPPQDSKVKTITLLNFHLQIHLF